MTARRVDWAAVRLAYEETAETIASIARRFGTYPASINTRMHNEGWTPRNGDLAAAQQTRRVKERPAPDLGALVASLQRTTARIVTVMEARLGKAEEGIDERDVRALGALASTLAKVISLQPEPRTARDETNQADNRPADVDADDGRNIGRLVELAERFIAARASAGVLHQLAAGTAGVDGGAMVDAGAAGPDRTGG
jgi:hypothetical protein